MNPNPFNPQFPQGYPAQPGQVPQVPGQVPQQGYPAQQAPPQQFAAPNTLQAPFIPPSEDWPEDGHLPEQGFSARTTLLPGIYDFVLPAATPQCLHVIGIRDNREHDANGMPWPTGPLGPYAQVDPQDPTKRLGAEVPRVQLKLDRNVPLVVASGPLAGTPMTATITNNPRPRGKKADAKTPWISDMAYLVKQSLQVPGTPRTNEEYLAILNQAAGRVIRLETGLTAQCRADKVRYIRTYDLDPATGQPLQELDPTTKQVRFKTKTIEDPQGKKGCGKRYYTDAFKNAQGGYDTSVACVCGTVTPEQKAAGYQDAVVEIRAFEQIERFLPPLGASVPQQMHAAPQGGYAPPTQGYAPPVQGTYAPPTAYAPAPQPMPGYGQPQPQPNGQPQGWPAGYVPPGGFPQGGGGNV